MQAQSLPFMQSLWRGLFRNASLLLDKLFSPMLTGFNLCKFVLFNIFRCKKFEKHAPLFLPVRILELPNRLTMTYYDIRFVHSAINLVECKQSGHFEWSIFRAQRKLILWVFPLSTCNRISRLTLRNLSYARSKKLPFVDSRCEKQQKEMSQKWFPKSFKCHNGRKSFARLFKDCLKNSEPCRAECLQSGSI